MPFRLLAAAFMAALLATLGLMFARVVTTPVAQLDVSEGDFLLLHHLALGFCGGLALQCVFLYRPPGIHRGLAWGAAGFFALTLMPWLILPAAVSGAAPGQVPADDPLRWLIVAGASAAGLWLLWWPGSATGDVSRPRRTRRRLAGLALLLLPVLAGALSGGADGPPSDPAMEGLDPDFGVWRGLALNLLFWLLLGLFSVLAARRVVSPQGPGPGAEAGPDKP